jgi:hypothetical protein
MKSVGFIKPGALSSEIIKTAKKEISSLKQEDVVILWTGANDISRNKSKDPLKNLSSFMSANDEVNMILINSLPRHDLMPTSCVDKEVNKFNRQLQKIVKLHENVRRLKVEAQREHFTRHGQHLNNKGKELVSLELSNLVKQCLKKETLAPLQMQWKEEKSDIHNKNAKNLEPVFDRDLMPNNGQTGIIRNEKSPSHNIDQEMHVKEVEKTRVCRTSSRLNKSTISRNKDFLW